MRHCRCCRVSIDDRPKQARECADCRAKECRKREPGYACKREPRLCLDCAVDIGNRRLGAKRCKRCAAAHERGVIRDWKSTNQEYNLARESAYRAANREQRRDWMYRTTYGITLKDYRSMYDRQGGRCFCCGDERPMDGRDGLAVDHCHETGVVRALLCPTCNMLEGFLKKNPKQYKDVLEYHSKIKLLRSA